MMTPTPWQDYDCPTQRVDMDLDGARMVHHGQAFHCPHCGSDHVAGVDVQINTYDADGHKVPLPADAQALAQLREQPLATATCIGCGCTDMHACIGSCWWLDVDRQAGKGVCSNCNTHEAAFQAQKGGAA